MAKLDEEQMEAVRHLNGPMLVLAGPGSGKTTVITKRIEYLLKEYKIKPETILVITFTRAAAAEMRERFHKLNEGCSGVTFGTFHAVFFMILKNAYNFTGANIITDEERIYIMRNLVRRLGIEAQDESDFISQVLSEISLIKNEALDLGNYYSKTCGSDEFRRLYAGYEKALESMRKIDFDDMLTMTYELFDQRKDILGTWQKRYKYILIDEFQDVNIMQYNIAKMLAGDSKNLFMVGDDDQSIYRFRGSKPEIMLNIETDFPGLKRSYLGKNYRCPSNITKLANNLISKNESRYEKSITSVKPGGQIKFGRFEDQRAECEYIINEIKKYIANGIDPQKIAVLFRVNTGARLLTEMLMDHNIEYEAKDTAPSIYNHWITKDIFAYMDIAHGSRKREDFLLIMNRPKRYLSKESLEYSQVTFQDWEKFYQEEPWIEKRIEDLEKDLMMIKRMSPYAAINYLRKAVGYDDFIKEYAEYRHIKAEDLFDILDELMESSKEFKSYENWLVHIVEYNKQLKEQRKSQKEKNRNAVQLVTLHSAKGLEYEVVFIIDVNEDVIPYKKAVLPQDIEEERRMLYVGITRSYSKLYLLCPKMIHGKEAEASRFIYDMGIDPE